MDRLTYYLFRIFILVFRFIPFSVLFLFADGIFYLLYYVAGYRKNVVFNNIRNSFPGKSEQDITQIAKAFYRHMADMLIESLKSFTMTEQAVVKRYKFHNTEFLDEIYRNGQSVVCVAGHYGNWEWSGISAGLQLKHKPVGFYKPLSNMYIDSYIQKTRVQGRSILASITKTADIFSNDWGEPAIFYMVADQSPSSSRLAYWVDFMNQDTATLHGPEKYARIHNMPVVFAYSKKIRRGCYDVYFQMLEPEPSKTKTGQITARFMQALEKVIIDEPQYYLWSHRRWKLKR